MCCCFVSHTTSRRPSSIFTQVSNYSCVSTHIFGYFVILTRAGGSKFASLGRYERGGDYDMDGVRRKLCMFNESLIALRRHSHSALMRCCLIDVVRGASDNFGGVEHVGPHPLKWWCLSINWSMCFDVLRSGIHAQNV